MPAERPQDRGGLTTPDGGNGGPPDTAAGREPPDGARMLLGAPIAASVRAELKEEVADLRDRYGFTPALAIVAVGEDPASAVYLQQILRTCRGVGAEGRLVTLPETAGEAALRHEIDLLNEDAQVCGVIVQMPLPAGFSQRTIAEAIAPAKDIDGIHPRNAGLLSLGYPSLVPATAQAAVEILTRSGYELAGLHAVVVGRSNVVGKPVAQLLLREQCTVTLTHSRTRDLAHHTLQADVVIAAAGRPGLITGEMLAPGALVVDVGINVVDGAIVGDVEVESARGVAAAISPVPGGVGPLTNAILLRNLLRAARDQRQGESRRSAG